MRMKIFPIFIEKSSMEVLFECSIRYISKTKITNISEENKEKRKRFGLPDSHEPS